MGFGLYMRFNNLLWPSTDHYVVGDYCPLGYPMCVVVLCGCGQKYLDELSRTLSASLSYVGFIH